MDRRDFLKISASAMAAGARAAPSTTPAAAQAAAKLGGPLTAPPIEMVRIDDVGIGGPPRG